MNNTIRTTKTKFSSVLNLFQNIPMRIPVLLALCLLAAGTVGLGFYQGVLGQWLAAR